MKTTQLALAAVLSVALTLSAFAAGDWFVATNGTGQGTNGWADATNDLQGAINACADNYTVWLSNGTYNVGQTIVATETNRVVINNAIKVRSANNNPATTIINGGGVMRCVYMNNANAYLIGVTVTNGFLPVVGTSGNGAGIRTMAGSVVSNCIFTGNNGNYGGGTVGMGKYYNCTMSGNTADYGGGSFQGTNYNCIISGNTGRGAGGGARSGTHYNCIISGNYGAWLGGGAHQDAILYNCTIFGNTTGGGGGGGVDTATLYNCISWGNHYVGSETTSLDQNQATYYSCGVGYTNGGSVSGNITNDPLFISTNNLRLQARSPCVNTGTNFSWMTDSADVRSKDLDMRPRVRYGTVDMGAYERIYEGTIFTFR